MKPNVRTYTALVTAMGNARQWSRALATIERMKHTQVANSSVEPNAYTYSALIKAMGEQVCCSPTSVKCNHSIIQLSVQSSDIECPLAQGEWEMAEVVFKSLEAEALGESPTAEQHLGRLAQPLDVSAVPLNMLF